MRFIETTFQPLVQLDKVIEIVEQTKNTEVGYLRDNDEEVISYEFNTATQMVQENFVKRGMEHE